MTILFHVLCSVLRGPGAEVGAGHHGAGEAGERAGYLSPGCHALPAGLLSGQNGRSVLDGIKKRKSRQSHTNAT